MNRERVIRRLEEIAQANFCRLFLESATFHEPSIMTIVFGAIYTGKTYVMKIHLNKIDESWSTAIERELAHLMEKDRMKAVKEHMNSIYGTMGLGKPTYVSHKVPKIKKVIFNDPATIIYWKDDTKTVVKAENELFDPEKGMAMAIAKKALGNQGKYYNEFKKWLPEEKEEDGKTWAERIRYTMGAAIDLLYAQYAYETVKQHAVGFDSVYEDYILELVGSEGLRALKEFHFIEDCGVVNLRQLYVLI